MQRIRLSTRRGGYTFIDLVVFLVVLVFFTGLLVPLIVQADETDNRKMCASNLRQIGQAMLLYANENHLIYPRGKYDDQHPDKLTAYEGADIHNPFGNDGPVNDVTVPLYLLLRTQDISSKVFICPSTKDGPSAADVQNTSNFAGAANLSYSIANAYPDVTAVAAGYRYDNSVGATFALAADKNPGGDVAKATKDSSEEQLKSANSPNHNGEGQNVLYGDGHVEFEKTPLCGVDQDNIYARGEHAEGDPVIGSPMNANDSVLLPTVDQGKPKKSE